MIALDAAKIYPIGNANRWMAGWGYADVLPPEWLEWVAYQLLTGGRGPAFNPDSHGKALFEAMRRTRILATHPDGTKFLTYACGGRLECVTAHPAGPIESRFVATDWNDRIGVPVDPFSADTEALQ